MQGALPYKVFQWGDIVANLLGSSLGLFFSFHAEKRFRARRELERLYAPLDIEDYGDFDDEDADDEEVTPRGSQGLRSSLKQTNTAPAGGASSSQGAGKKKARFGNNDIWDDSVEIETLPAPHSRPKAAESSQSTSSSTRKEDLFSIDDDEDDDSDAEGGKGNGKSLAAEETNVWKQAES